MLRRLMILFVFMGLLTSCEKPEPPDPLANYVPSDDPRCNVEDCSYLSQDPELEKTLRDAIKHSPGDDCAGAMDKDVAKNNGTATIHVFLDSKPTGRGPHPRTAIPNTTIQNELLTRCIADSVVQRTPFAASKSKVIVVVTATIDIDPNEVPDPDKELTKWGFYMKGSIKSELTSVMVQLPVGS